MEALKGLLTGQDWNWILLFLALIGAWVLLRMVLKLTVKIFFIGCSTLLVLAILVFILRFIHVIP